MHSPLRTVIFFLAVLGAIYYASSHLWPAIFTPLSVGLTKDRRIEVVLSYYREDIPLVRQQIQDLRRLLWNQDLIASTTVYVKDESAPLQYSAESLSSILGADRVIFLRNRGREGGTFLSHIISNYDGGLAPLTLFGQSLLEQPRVYAERISLLRDDTAFMSLGKYAQCDCGRDTRGYFPRMREIYSMFTGRLCPGGGQLCTYKGQFIVSKASIHENPKAKYIHLLDVLEADTGHWIYDDIEDQQWEYRGHKSGPSSPFFGHALERSWPTIFGCTDPSIARNCTPGSTPLESPFCQCIHH